MGKVLRNNCALGTVTNVWPTIALTALLLLMGSHALGFQTSKAAGAENLNVVPNAELARDGGQKAGTVNGTVPDFWRGFAVGGGEITLTQVPLAPNTLYPGSPAVNAIRLTVNNTAGDQGFDHEGSPFSILPGQSYRGKVYLRSEGGTDQMVSVGFPIFDGNGFTGRAPGSFTVTVTDTWNEFSGPSFQEADLGQGNLSFRLLDSGGTNSVLIALPSVEGPLPDNPVDYPPVATAGRGFGLTDKYISTIVFQWFTSYAGQISGPWRPEEGRAAWTGDVNFWRRQIKDIMDANIDVMNVHLFQDFEFQRENLFKAYYQLRCEGYDTPYLLPFLDPLILWSQGAIDLATTSGKDAFAAPYIRWFQQYFRNNPDPDAASRLLIIDNRLALNTWHCNPGFTDNIAALTRQDLQSRLEAAFPDQPSFQNGIYQMGSANGLPPTFADEINNQFSNNEYFSTFLYDGKRPATLKAGYWDQNVRNPGSFLPRNGGAEYRQAWEDLLADQSEPPVHHVFLESWNEYDEGTGIYSGDTGAPFIGPNNTGGNDDTWSQTANPREYIETAYEGASQFNQLPALDSAILWHDFPDTLMAGASATARILVRNTGNMKWSTAAGIRLGQADEDGHQWGVSRVQILDDPNEVQQYGGVFRGRPVLFEFEITAPSQPGTYTSHFQMLRLSGGDQWFGEELALETTVTQAARTLVYSWISSNAQFESILVVDNFGDQPANLTLTAQRATGPGETVMRTVPAHGFLRETASSLFQVLGAGSGYTVTVTSDVATVQGGWVTNNLDAASGRSPSQGVAVVVPADPQNAGERVGTRLLFTYLPITEGLTSAPVLVNLGEETAGVTMRFYNQAGDLVATDSTTLANLTPLRPFAAVANTLVPAGSGDVYMIAESDGAPITGVGFVFNTFSEPALGNVTAIDDANTSQKLAEARARLGEKRAGRRLVYSWISSNAQFESILVVDNFGDQPTNLTLTAQRATGPGETVMRTVPAHGFLRETASSLFQALGAGSGYTVTVTSDIDTVLGGWITNNLDAASGRSPSQGVAVVVPESPNSAGERVGTKLLFTYLPITDGLTSAPVMVNLSEADTSVTMRFYNQAGDLVATDNTTLASLTPLRPFAAVANALVTAGTGDLYMVAESNGALITGVGFVFNTFSEPALGNVTAIP